MGAGTARRVTTLIINLSTNGGGYYTLSDIFNCKLLDKWGRVLHVE